MNNEGIGYKIGYILGWLSMSIIRSIMTLFYNGIVKASKKYTVLLVSYLGLFFITIIAIYQNAKYSVPLLIIVILALAFGIYITIKEYPFKKLQKYFKSIFEEIKLYAENKSTPLLLSKEENEYTIIYNFYSLIAITEWKKKKEVLEMYLNKEILDILQDKYNNRITHVVLKKTPLLEYIEWEDDKYLDLTDAPLFSLGLGYYDLALLDLNKTPHVFLAGATGDGKSNILKCLIHQSLSKNFDTILIDFKRGVSFVEFSDAVTIYYEHETTKELLEQLVEETKHRLDLFREARIDNIDDYKKNVNKHLKRKIVFIDELAELLQVRDKELSHSLYDSLETLTRLARTTGIHLVMGMQRVDSTIITGQIKSNVAGRICGRFVDKEPSQIMLNNDMASKLVDVKGRFIYKDDTCVEVQCFYYKGSENAKYRKNIQYKIETAKVENEELSEKDSKENFEPSKERHNIDEIPFDFSDID